MHLRYYDSLETFYLLQNIGAKFPGPQKYYCAIFHISEPILTHCLGFRSIWRRRKGPQPRQLVFLHSLHRRDRRGKGHEAIKPFLGQRHTSVYEHFNPVARPRNRTFPTSNSPNRATVKKI
jgi:hypothetical protein